MGVMVRKMQVVAKDPTIYCGLCSLYCHLKSIPDFV